MGIAFHGWYCRECCYACSGEFTLTLEEFHAMARNRLASEDRRAALVVAVRSRKKGSGGRRPGTGRKHGQILDYSLPTSMLHYTGAARY
jgi:alpha-D-ribose 1-methylphosphonate 5-triphosphate synthase subunit PhnH